MSACDEGQMRSLRESTCFLAVSEPYQNPIYGRHLGVLRRAKSRFPRLLERLRKRETEWKVWKGISRAQGRSSIKLHSLPLAIRRAA